MGITLLPNCPCADIASIVEPFVPALPLPAPPVTPNLNAGFALFAPMRMMEGCIDMLEILLSRTNRETVRSDQILLRNLNCPHKNTHAVIDHKHLKDTQPTQANHKLCVLKIHETF